MTSLLKRKIFYSIFFLIPVSIFTQANYVNEPKPGDADFPVFPANSNWAMDRHQQKLNEIKAGNYDLALIGNSICQTIGEIGGKYEPLKAVWKKYFVPLHAINLAYSGFRIENILWNLHHGELEFETSPKLFVILIGTNNADSRNFPFAHTAEQIFAGTKAIVDLIRKRHPSSKILIIRIFPKGLDNQRNEATSPPIFTFPQSDVDTANCAGKLTENLADNRYVFWLDINHIFLRQDGKINVELMPDLLHPNLAGAEAWVAALEHTMLKLMSE
jgi:lysophospholipase L1-like esterase